MKLQCGMRYVTKSGTATGQLKVNNKRAASFPYLDTINNVEYDEEGNSYQGLPSEKIVKEYKAFSDYIGSPLPHSVDTVTISRKDYDRFIEMEKFVKWIATEAKQEA